MIGQKLNDRYEITARLGKGAMGIVYRATDLQSHQEVALKVISNDLVVDPDMLERFKREGEALSKLKHPNIVEFLDAFQHEESYVIVMEYVLGGSLHELISKGPLPMERANRIALELCDALIRSHHLNIIHRDLKPENVLLAEDGTPKLADFGVARLSEGTRMTRSGTQVGTPYYMSPEAWEGKTLDVQADIWSLGVILFEMLTGQVPFGGDTGAAVMNKVLTTQPPDMKKLRADVPPNLAQIIKQMLTRDKTRRYQTMRQLAADLESGQLTASKPRPTAGISGKRASLIRWIPMLIGVGIILTLTILWQTSQFQTPQATEINATSVALTATISSSESEVETLTPVVASIAAGTVLFDENFEDDRVQGIGFSAETGWNFVTDETGNKVYELDNRNGSAYKGFSFGMDEWTDYSVEYRTRFLNSSGSQPELGLQVRAYDNTYYVLVLGEEESYLAYSLNGSEWTRLNTQLIHVERDAWQNVRVVVQGEQVSVYLNSSLLINAKSSQIRQGWVMIFVGTNTYAQVDDLRVVRVDEQSNSSATYPTLTVQSPSTAVTTNDRTYLADLTPLSSEVGYFSFGIGKYPFTEGPFFEGVAIQANGVSYPHALFTHAPSELIYSLNEAYSSFVSDIFIDGYNTCSGTAQFIVLLDGRAIYRSDELIYQFPVVEIIDIELDISGGKQLVLITNDLGDLYCDMTVWGDPYLVP